MKGVALAGLLLTLTFGPTVSAAQEQGRPLPFPAPPAATTTNPLPIRSAATQGEPHHLHLDGDTLSYCDKRGARAIDLQASRDAARAGTCPAAEEPNAACSQLGIDVEVRAPLSAPDDILDVGGISIPLKGRVHDCAVDGTLMAIATGSRVNLVDVASAMMITIDRAGGERIVVGPNWIVWSAERGLRWIPRPQP